MVDSSKHHHHNNLLSPTHRHNVVVPIPNLTRRVTSLFTTRSGRTLFRTKGFAFAYAFLLIFAGYTLFLAFAPSATSSSSARHHTAGTVLIAHPLTPPLVPSDGSPNLTVARDDTALPSPHAPTGSVLVHGQDLNSTSSSSGNGTTESEARATPAPGLLPEPSLKNNSASTPGNATTESGTGSGLPVNEAGGGGSEEEESSVPPSPVEVSSGPGLNSSSSSVPGNDTSEPPLLPGPGLIIASSHGNHSTVSSVKEESLWSNLTASLSKKQQQPQVNNSEDTSPPPSNSSSSSAPPQPSGLESLANCDFYDGVWVRDESYPLYPPGSCELIDEQFNCFANGRPDPGFHKLKWKPKACSLPRLKGRRMIKLLRGKRLVFVGDSLNRNMWESLICILRNSVKNRRNVFEATGRVHFKTEAFYSFVFKDYNFTIDFYASPFLVRQWGVIDKNGTVKETLRIDAIAESADQFKDADVLVFNTGHWWTHEKTSKGQDYYQEGRLVHRELNVVEAFRRAMTTWAKWIDANIDPSKTHVLFRGYSVSHFSGGQWNSGGACDNETEPISNEAYLTQVPFHPMVLESVLQGMKTKVSYLNVTRQTDFRKDGHPSIYRKKMITEEERRSPMQYQDCSHWCLPGVPDAWNELLYAELLRRQHLKNGLSNQENWNGK